MPSLKIHIIKASNSGSWLSTETRRKNNMVLTKYVIIFGKAIREKERERKYVQVHELEL